VCKRACDTKAGCSGNGAAISIAVHAKKIVCAVKQLTRVVASQRTRTFSRAFAFASRSPSASSLSPTFSKLRLITITTCKSRSTAVVPRCDKRRSHGAFDKRSVSLSDNDSTSSSLACGSASSWHIHTDTEPSAVIQYLRNTSDVAQVVVQMGHGERKSRESWPTKHALKHARTVDAPHRHRSEHRANGTSTLKSRRRRHHLGQTPSMAPACARIQTTTNASDTVAGAVDAHERETGVCVMSTVPLKRSIEFSSAPQALLK
jgi:hypothetical protein